MSFMLLLILADHTPTTQSSRLGRCPEPGSRITICSVNANQSVLLAYFDGSGNSRGTGTRSITLAGYVGTEATWGRLQANWQDVLERWNCRYLHMREARSLIGEFAASKGWTHDRVDLLLAALFNECLAPSRKEEFSGQFYGASCSVNLPDYRKGHAEIKNLKEPESLCVDFVVTVALMALPENREMPLGKEGTMKLVFDNKELFMSKVVRAWTRRRRNKRDPLSLITSAEKQDAQNCAGLQAADFLAWSTNRYLGEGLTTRFSSMAGLFRVLATPGFECHYDYARLKADFS